jgi:hypothetical protein
VSDHDAGGGGHEQLLDQGVGGAWVDVLGRFVDQQNLGAAQQGAGDQQSPSLPARQRSSAQAGSGAGGIADHGVEPVR